MAEQTPEERATEERIEEQVKAEMEQQAGVQPRPGETWEDVARRLEEQVRSEVARWLGMQPGATWAEVGQSVESHTKATLGGWAGATPTDSWEIVGRKIEARIRERAARWSGVEPGRVADWDEIGRQVERRVRAGLGRPVGAPEGADWGTVASHYRARIDAQLRERFARTRPAGEAPAEEEAIVSTGEGEKVHREEFRVSGSEVLGRLKALIREGNIRRIIIKQDERVLVEIPLTLGVVGAILAPQLAAIGAIAALAAECTIVVERAE